MSARRVIAIDGPSGVGKSTVAQGVAERLRLPYLETGAMYRAVGLEVVEAGLDPDDRPAVEALAAELTLELNRTPGGAFEIRIHGEPVGIRIYGLRVTEVTSKISAYPGVRARMRELQRACANRNGGVLEGRDIGTRVVPETDFKYFLTADPQVRAERRWRQLTEAGALDLEVADIEREVRSRDQRDSNRDDSPLRWDETYRVIDTGELAVAEVIEAIVSDVEERSPESSGEESSSD
ncbi:MAG: (d)CMP kinase [Thermoanaerobaculia bacterium]